MAERTDDVIAPGEPTTAAPDATATDTHYKADGRDSERIRRDIRHTRDAMHATLQALEQRLSPHRIVDQITDTFRDEVRRSRVLNTLRANPLPVMMLTAGAAWLGIDAAKGGKAAGEPRDRVVSKAGSALSGAKARAAGALGAVKAKARQASQTAGEKLSQGGQGAQETASRFQAGAGRMRQAAANARDETAARYQEHPLTLGALAAAAGLAVGLLAPSSRAENELLGEAGHKARQRLGAAGEKLTEKGKEVGQAAAEAAESEAEPQHPPTDY